MAGLIQEVLQVAGKVKWTDPSRYPITLKHGCFILLRAGHSETFSVEVKQVAPLRSSSKIKLVRNRFTIHSRSNRLSMTFSDNNLTLIVQEANESQLKKLIEMLNDINTGNIKKALKSSQVGRSPLQQRSRQRLHENENIENQPLNSNRSTSSTPSQSSEANQFLSSQRQASSPQPSLVRASTLRSQVQTNRRNSYVDRGRATDDVSIGSSKKYPLAEKMNSPDNQAINSDCSKSASSFYGSINATPSSLSKSGSMGALHSNTCSDCHSISDDYNSDSKRTIGLSTSNRLRHGLTLSSKDFSFRKRVQFLYDQKEVQLTGFSNLGNTCYMNAILQSLLGIEPFAQDLANKELLESINSQCLYKCTYGLLCCKKNKCPQDLQRLHLRKFKKTISQAATRFSGHLQHDAHEFLCQVLDQLKEDVNTHLPKEILATVPAASPAKELSETLCPVTRSFECGVMHTISCKECGESVTREEIYHDFSLDLPALFYSSNEVSPVMNGLCVDRLIESYFQPEELEYTCEECGCKQATISHKISRLPRVLILHMKRYDFNKVTDKHAKKQNNINIRKFIDIGNLCTNKTSSPLKFEAKTVNLSPGRLKLRVAKRPLEDDDSGDDFVSGTTPTARRQLQPEFSKSTKSQDTPVPLVVDTNKEPKGAGEVTPIKQPITSTRHTPKRNCLRPDFDFEDFDDIDSTSLNIESRKSEGVESVLKLPEDKQIEWALKESMKSAEVSSPECLYVDTDLTDNGINLDCTDDELLSALESGCEDTENSGKNAISKGNSSDKSKSNCSVFHKGANDGDVASDEDCEGRIIGGAPVSDSESLCVTDASDQSGLDIPKPGSNKRTKLVVLSSDCGNESSDSIMETDDDDCRKRGKQLKDNSLCTLMDRKPVLSKFSGDLIIGQEDHRGKNVGSARKRDAENNVSCRQKNLLHINSRSPFNTKFRPKFVTAKDSINTKYPKESEAIYSNSDSSVDEKSELSDVSSNSARRPYKRRHRKIVDSNDNDETSQPEFHEDDIAKAIAKSLEVQNVVSSEDEELKQALELSLQEFTHTTAQEEHIPGRKTLLESKQLEKEVKPCSPHNRNGILYNSVDSGFQGDEDIPTHSYRLVSVVSHLGDRSSSGHYISDVYDCRTGEWTSYDDSTATKVDEHKVRYGRSKEAYILFYLYKQCVDLVKKAPS